MYLDMKLECIQLHNGTWAWLMSPTKYVQEKVRICEEYVAKHLSKDYHLPKRADNPFTIGYCFKLDVSLLFRPDKASYYQPLIRVMKWMVKIECMDINTKLSLLSSYSAMPRWAFEGSASYHGLPEALV